jgi:flavin reductase (DIM6/NTAB) family NADH-FMN oxidoreductase RutF
MKSFLPSDLEPRYLYSFFTSAIVPRPIAWISTIDQHGVPNLSPFSYFNMMSTRPPVMVFSPGRNIRNGKQKDTYENIKEVGECVIHMVSFALAEKMNHTSASFPRDIDEFKEAGLEAIPSDLVRPLRLKDSPLAFECKIIQVVELGTEGGAGCIVICEILKIHVDESILTERGTVDILKLDVIGRLGGNQYCRIGMENVFELMRPE